MQMHLAFFPKAYQQQLLRYRRWQDAQLSLLGKLLLKAGMLRLKAEVDFERIQYTEYNKPYVQNIPITFNISHSEELVVCALSENQKYVGVDIEKIRPIELADYKAQMTESEQQLIYTAAQPQEAFFKYWTEKEAVIKAHGHGLSIPLQSFEIKENCAHIDGEVFYVWEIPLKKDYCCHIASNQYLPSEKINIENIHVNRFLQHEE